MVSLIFISPLFSMVVTAPMSESGTKRCNNFRQESYNIV